LAPGVLAAVWSAVTTMVGGVTFGFVLALVARARLERILVTDPDYLRSGWTDVKAFVLANAFDNPFDNGFTCLLGALVVGLVGAARESAGRGGRLVELPSRPRCVSGIGAMLRGYRFAVPGAHRWPCCLPRCGSTAGQTQDQCRVPCSVTGAIAGLSSGGCANAGRLPRGDPPRLAGLGVGGNRVSV